MINEFVILFPRNNTNNFADAQNWARNKYTTFYHEMQQKLLDFAGQQLPIAGKNEEKPKVVFDSRQLFLRTLDFIKIIKCNRQPKLLVTPKEGQTYHQRTVIILFFQRIQ